jgi:hypothetical protein
MTALNKHLVQHYRAAVMGSGSIQAAVSHFVAAAKDNPDLMAQAQTELARCQALPPGRCFVSDKTREFLELALGKS